ncbi:MAG: DUF2946 family protein [Phycisphaeraceae bacterium]
MHTVTGRPTTQPGATPPATHGTHCAVAVLLLAILLAWFTGFTTALHLHLDQQHHGAAIAAGDVGSAHPVPIPQPDHDDPDDCPTCQLLAAPLNTAPPRPAPAVTHDAVGQRLTISAAAPAALTFAPQPPGRAPPTPVC